MGDGVGGGGVEKDRNLMYIIKQINLKISNSNDTPKPWVLAMPVGNLWIILI